MSGFARHADGLVGRFGVFLGRIVGVIVGVFTVQLAAARSIHQDPQNIVVAERLHGAGNRVYGGVADSHNQQGAMAQRAEQAGVRLLLENTPYCFRPTLKNMVDVINDVDHQNLGIVYDVANAAYVGEDPVEGLLTYSAAICLVHISDTGLDEWGHDPIGTGVVDFEALGRAVEATGRGKDVVLEIIRDKNPLGEITTGIDELKKRGWKLLT